MVSLSCCHVQVRAVSSLRVDLSLQQLKDVNLILKTVRPCCVFHSLYMTCSFQIVNWYLGSVLLFAEKERMVQEKVAEKDRMVAEKDRMVQEKVAEKDRMVAEKDRMVEEKDRMVEEKDRMVEEKDKRIAEKDQTIQILQESADVATALRETRRAETGRKWGK
jgi:hypothetical protein